MIYFKCPVCGCKDTDVIMSDVFSVGEVIECPDCLNLLLVKDEYRLEDFKDILAEQVAKRNSQRPKAVGKWDDHLAISVRYL